MKLIGLCWKDLNEDVKEFLLDGATTSDENCNEVEEGLCIVDLTDKLSIDGIVVDGEIIIDDDSVIYNPEEGISHLPYKEKMERLRDIENLHNILTVTEIAGKLGIAEGTIRAAIKRKEFIEGVDFRKAGRITLIRRDSVEKVYGDLDR